MRNLLKSFIFFCFSLFAAASFAQNFHPPTQLEPWVDWVKGRHLDWNCAKSEGSYVCVWPGVAKYTIGKEGGDFLLKVELLATGVVPLSFSKELAPRDIQVKDSAGKSVDASFEQDEESLGIKLQPGRYEITGRFTWDKVPLEIPVPEEYGIVETVLDGSLSGSVVRRVAGVLRLEEKDESSPDEEQQSELSLSVFRKVSDGSPLKIDTLLKFRVSGKGRSLDLGKILPAGTLPVSVHSDLPLSLSGDGQLAIQLVSGEFSVNVESVIGQPVDSLVLPSPQSADWPNEEAWSWYGDAKFRAVELNGVTNVAGALTDLPEEWRSGSTYLVQKGGTVDFKTLRRGEQLFTPQTISLRKELWIDLDGSEFTVVDRFSGTLRKRFRMNAAPELQISRASSGSLPVFVTKDPASGQSGIEVRDEAVNIEAVSRLRRTTSIPAVGWDQTVENLNLTLHLPPSWELLAATGTQYAWGSWWESWTLLDLFLVILLGISFYKLFGRNLALILSAALILFHAQFQAPRILFVHLALLFGWKKLLGDSKSWVMTLCQGLIALTFAALCLESLTFGKLQFTQMLFPQLQAGTRYRTVLQELLLGMETSWISWPLILILFGYLGFAIRHIFKASGIWKRIWLLLFHGVVVVVLMTTTVVPILFFGPTAGGGYQRMETMNAPISEYADELSAPQAAGGIIPRSGAMKAKRQMPEPKAAEQKGTHYPSLLSGAAVPSWRWRTHELSVAGPVDQHQTIGLILLPPNLMRFICGLRAFLALALVVLLYGTLGFPKPKRTQFASLLFLFLFSNPERVYADFPSDSVLNELEARLNAQRCGRESCATIEHMQLGIKADHFNLALRVLSEGASAVKLPGPLEVFAPRHVVVNGQDSPALRRVEDDFLELKVPAGRSLITIEGMLPLRPAFALQFKDKPLSLDFESSDWMQAGLLASGVVPDVLRLNESGATEGNSKKSEEKTETRLSSWVVMRRRLEIREEQTLETTLTRVGDTSQAAIFKLPLLAGERVTSGGFTTEGDQLVVSFPAGTSELSYHGLLPKADSIELVSKPISRVSEEWEVFCDAIYSCESQGITPSQSVKDGVATNVWQPFPGEKVQIKVSQLSGISGDFVTLDTAEHQVNAGLRQYDGTLRASLRVTKESLVSLKFDADSQVQSLSLDGEQGKGLGAEKGVSLLVPPGSHSLELRYMEPREPTLLEKIPAVSISVPTHNLTTTLIPAQDRWILWTGGALWGPSVVFWGKLLILCLISYALSRYGLLGVSGVSSIFLGIGLTSAPTFLVTIPFVWLVLLHAGGPYREKLLPRFPKISRIAVILASVLALLVLYGIVETGLVLAPPMLIAGNGSSASSLRWFVDHTQQELPRPWVMSLPIWTWRGFSLVWSSWLVISLLAWLKRTFKVVRDLV